ncbi:hypothetical protein EHQ12_07725 [Leptospira gomenensis]|uniref:Uncharacterized protein n=1 Tax=Leptospira gomenensis TaxID=2484974 RepID=A0A5F1YB79_9LEPT|nr:hypothetical protein [Leptospira gomenensis]TGK34570.1 hypothetical protein EHQ17_09120 [Leptospira gomenensis]TGK40120.1 hypothetical protein EHQ07_18780 [Leptospira gomenensis]TGK40470.1 hypothetical protein EHQ12_07725 [Leptospira gomenensis]TGK55629.1 hypothetical protein EHQ13_17005 [Leptospira gomenensis]
MNINGTANQSLLLERVANMPKEIFQTQNEDTKKMLRYLVENKLLDEKVSAGSRLLDTYA